MHMASTRKIFHLNSALNLRESCFDTCIDSMNVNSSASLLRLVTRLQFKEKKKKKSYFKVAKLQKMFRFCLHFRRKFCHSLHRQIKRSIPFLNLYSKHFPAIIVIIFKAQSKVFWKFWQNPSLLQQV